MTDRNFPFWIWITKISFDPSCIKELGWPYTREFKSPDDAVNELRRQLLRERSRSRHWSYDPNRHIGIKQRLILARYFRRFGERIWYPKGATNQKVNHK